MYSLTLLSIQPSQLVNFPKCPDHNFFIWTNVDLHVHRFDSVLKSFQIKYNTDEYMEQAFYQYGTNEFEDLSRVNSSIDNLPPAKLVSEHRISVSYTHSGLSLFAHISRMLYIFFFYIVC